MGFPNSPINGETAVVNGITYTYDSTRTAWVRSSATAYNLYTASNIAPTSPKFGDQWYYIASDTLFEYISDGTSSYWVDTQSLGQVGNISSMSDTTLSGNVVVGLNNVYSIGASNGYIKNLFANAVTANAITVNGNIIPSANVTYNLGSTTNRFKDLWLSGNTIYLGGATMSTDGANVTISNPQGGSFSVAGSSSGNANVSFGNVFANYFFANGAAFTSSSYGNTDVAAYLVSNPQGSTYSNANVAAYLVSGSSGLATRTDALTIPIGTTAQRPATTANGMIRFNTTLSVFEMYFPTSGWQSLYRDNTYQVTAFIWGGGGGGGAAGAGVGGGAGAAVGTFTVTKGSAYPVTVGGGGDSRAANAGTGTAPVGGGGLTGSAGYGGQGGGYSGIFTSTTLQANAILIAGGGGGASYEGANGGVGGGTTGGSGGSGASTGGGGGTQSAGGTSGSTAGSALQGGQSSGDDNGGGGGGGGGYFGGGGGRNNNPGAAGGGGSGYFNPALVSTVTLYSGSSNTAGNPTDLLRNPITAGNGGAAGQNAGQAGLVVIRYLGSLQVGSGGSATIGDGYVYHTFTSSGTFTA